MHSFDASFSIIIYIPRGKDCTVKRTPVSQNAVRRSIKGKCGSSALPDSPANSGAKSSFLAAAAACCYYKPNMASDPGEGCFDKHSSSFNSTSSQTPLNDQRQQTFSPNTLNTEAEPAENTTYFLLDIEDDQQQERAGSTLSFEHSSDTSSSRSSRSSVSAQVVIDHGNSLPRRLDKHIANHVFRSDNDESESDYAYSYAHHDHADQAMTPERSPSQRSGERMQEEASYQLTSKDQKRVSRDHIRNESYDADHENGKGVMTVYTEEDEDLAEELPTWDQERIREQQELSSDVPDDHHRPKQKRHAHDMHQHQRKMKKRLPKGINADLHSHSWSRRESVQNLRRPGLSSEEALQYVSFDISVFSWTISHGDGWFAFCRRLLTTARQILEDERARICKTICKSTLSFLFGVRYIDMTYICTRCQGLAP